MMVIILYGKQTKLLPHDKHYYNNKLHETQS